MYKNPMRRRKRGGGGGGGGEVGKSLAEGQDKVIMLLFKIATSPTTKENSGI